MTAHPKKSESEVSKILYALHGYDPGEVPLLDAQIHDTAQALEALYNQRIEAARIDELESITGFSDVGGVHTSAGTTFPKGRTQPIRKRIEQLRTRAGINKKEEK